MSRQYLVGPPGTGKTSRLIERLVSLLEQNVRPDRVLVLVPQQSQAGVFRAALARVQGAHRPRGEPDIHTIYSLARQHVSLFFPLIAPVAGFGNPAQQPVVINVEAVQYIVDRLVQPRLEDFADLKLPRPHLVRQIIDNMNKAAVCGFPLDQIAERLGAAWTGDSQRLVSYRRAQDVALAFRRFCLARSLLDFSLLMELFARHLLPAQSYQDYIAARYRYVLADNLEENPPVTHDFLRLLLRTCDSALLAEDDPGGYRLFLGADVASAHSLRQHCDVIDLDQVFVAPPAVVSFGLALMAELDEEGRRNSSARSASGVSLPPALGDSPGAARYWTEMVDWVVERIRRLVNGGALPSDIAVLAPFVEDVLRFELEERLRADGIGVWSVRPSRPLYDHPLVRALVALARLAHPHWQRPVPVGELARALASLIADLDVARAQLIADAALRAAAPGLPPIEDPAVWQRVGSRFQPPYAVLCQWLAHWQARTIRSLAGAESAPLDQFWQQMFSDVLSHPGFTLHIAPAEAVICDRLIRSARAFYEAMERAGPIDTVPHHEDAGLPGIAPRPFSVTTPDLGLEYITILSQGFLGAQYALEREQPTADLPGASDILLAPVYAYLTSNFRSRYQFWLANSSLGWYERIYQPLTHPYVLSRRWKPGMAWSEADERRERQAMLRRLVGGLLYRCSAQVFVASSRLG
ncbi:MAG: UvrD-helicase domain-containing protein, partial [Candidatus Roseilinea sp.]|uniref:UvrD-helicase domain-containing protein n=1 Tax=Candidatus Roseilinea sp. TaxID=2838777 RepID=UPI00404A0209